MKVEFKHAFIKTFHKRFDHHPNIQKRFNERFQMFVYNSSNPLLGDHPLKGSKSRYRAFSVTGDIRVVYVIHCGAAYFLDIGTHNQVYT